MFNNTAKNKSIASRATMKPSHLLASILTVSTLMAGLGVTTMTSQAASLGDLFNSDKSGAKQKFLPVDKAFQVSSNTKAGS